MKEHELKTDGAVFAAVRDGLKTYEIRKDDRGFAVGDILILRPTRYTGEQMKCGGAPLEYLGDSIRVEVIHILRGPIYGLAEGWVIMSIKILPPQQPSGGTGELRPPTDLLSKDVNSQDAQFTKPREEGDTKSEPTTSNQPTACVKQQEADQAAQSTAPSNRPGEVPSSPDAAEIASLRVRIDANAEQIAGMHQAIGVYQSQIEALRDANETLIRQEQQIRNEANKLRAQLAKSEQMRVDAVDLLNNARIICRHGGYNQNEKGITHWLKIYAPERIEE